MSKMAHTSLTTISKPQYKPPESLIDIIQYKQDDELKTELEFVLLIMHRTVSIELALQNKTYKFTKEPPSDNWQVLKKQFSQMNRDNNRYLNLLYLMTDLHNLIVRIQKSNW